MNAKSRRRQEQAKRKAARKAAMKKSGMQSKYARKVSGNPAPTSLYAAGNRYENYKPFGARK